MILWTAFATFGVLAFASIRLATDYWTTASIDLTAHADQAQGIVQVKRPGQGEALWSTADRELPVGTWLTTQRAGTLHLTFFENSQMTLLSDSRVELASMNVGRFITSRSSLQINQSDGPVRYQTAGEIDVRVPNGLVRVGPGNATVWVDGQGTNVLVYGGTAQLEAAGSSVAVPAGSRASLSAERRLVGPEPRARNLLVNGDFTRGEAGWEPDDLQVAPKDVNGERRATTATIAGVQVPALRIIRESVKQQHGETRLRQQMNLDVSGYRSLYVDAWVRVDGASLPGGGQLGSEYPMMLRLQYEGPQEGSQPDWLVGFFAQQPDGWPLPEKIAQQVPAGQWFHFRSPNLMDQEMSRRPFTLRRFEVMGQGHSYDAQVADMHIVGD